MPYQPKSGMKFACSNKTKSQFIMKHFLLLLVTVFAAAVNAAAPEPLALVETRASDNVLVCVSSKAYAFHAHYCNGLKRCRGEIITMARDRAIEAGRTPCGYCYRTTRRLSLTAN